MKYIGIDYGRARIGIAQSDNGILARPIGTIKNKGFSKTIAELAKYTTGCGCILGIPLDIDGNETGMCNIIREFGAQIERELGVTVEYQNERYSSADAEQYIREIMGINKREKVKELVDAVAATMILNDYLGGKK